MAIKKEQVYGYWVLFEEEFRNGINYLENDLQVNEAKTIFSAAKLNGSAEFEDDQDRDWTLIYNRQDYNYTLVKRNRE
jgi:hypothetical protein